jgi:hypothetical protein
MDAAGAQRTADPRRPLLRRQGQLLAVAELTGRVRVTGHGYNQRILMRAAGVLCGCVLAVCVPASASAQDRASRPTMTAVPVPAGASVRIDGVLDEPVWRTAQPATGFLQRDPDNGAPATERTEVRVVFESDRLIVGATLFDSEPDRLLGNQLQRDQSFSADDRFIVTLDTFADGRGGYVFQTNPVGAQADALIVPSTNTSDDAIVDFGAGLNESWDGIWIARVRRTADSWTVEMEIPFGTLNFDPRLEAWGINFQRTVRRKAEDSVWSGHLRNEGVAHMASAGRIDGLSGLSQGLGLDLKPYVVGNLSSAPGRGHPARVATGDAGFDVFYSVTPALRGNLSIKTDFAETEVDDQQVNLTRFPQFYQEKRDFFLQGASYFDFAREIGNQVTPFFSRRIGLDGLGVPQPIEVGAKLTGQIGAFDVGVLQVRTADTAGQIGTDFSASRVRRRLGQESYVGALYTRRADRVSGGRDLLTAGVDFALRTTVLGRKTLEWSGWYLYTTNPFDTGENIGRGMRVAFPNDPFYFDMSYRELQDNYSPAVGFVQRNGFRRYNPEVGYTWRFRDHPWIRSIQQEVDWQFLHDKHNRLLSQDVAIRPLTMVLNDGSQLAYEAEVTYERLEEDFEIDDGVVLPAGQVYRFTRHQIDGSTADRYVVAVGGAMVFGDFFSGRRQDYEIDISVRPRTGVALSAALERSVLTLAEGSFETNLVRATANTQFSPWMSVVNTIQYDDVSRLLGWQLRFRWIQRPGNDLFFVYTHNWRELESGHGRRFGTLDNRAATKVVYTRRF